jgi:hypothetical protein
VKATWKLLLATAGLVTAVGACAANGSVDLGSVLEGVSTSSQDAPAPEPTNVDDAGNSRGDTPPEPTEELPPPMPTDSSGNPID